MWNRCSFVSDSMILPCTSSRADVVELPARQEHVIIQHTLQRSQLGLSCGYIAAEAMGTYFQLRNNNNVHFFDTPIQDHSRNPEFYAMCQQFLLRQQGREQERMTMDDQGNVRTSRNHIRSSTLSKQLQLSQESEAFQYNSLWEK